MTEYGCDTIGRFASGFRSIQVSNALSTINTQKVSGAPHPTQFLGGIGRRLLDLHCNHDIVKRVLIIIRQINPVT